MLGLDTIVGVGMKLIDKLIPDPAAKAQAQLELAKLGQEGKLAEIQADTAEQQEVTKRAEADPLFFKAQRGEGTMADWEAKVAEIKARYPKV